MKQVERRPFHIRQFPENNDITTFFNQDFEQAYITNVTPQCLPVLVLNVFSVLEGNR